MTEPPASRLTSPPEALAADYPVVVIGSGYGGAVTAARLAEAGHEVCLLERGREWVPGEFPDSAGAFAKAVRRKGSPLGLFDLYLCNDIDVLKGNGLGGGSLINASVAFRPDRELFAHRRWPRVYRELADAGELWPYYQRAERMLRAAPHPHARDLVKVGLLERRAAALPDARFRPSSLAVNFEFDGPNHVGVLQRPCVGCNDCITGCNVGAKNILTTNYLPHARRHGARIFTQIEVRHLEALPAGGYRLHYRRNESRGHGEPRALTARRVVVAAGALGSVEILLRSAREGLAVSPRLGHGFSGNGDYLGLAYNTDQRADVLGSPPAAARVDLRPGPTIVATIQHDRSRPFAERITVQDFSVFPSGLVGVLRRALPPLAKLRGEVTDGSLGYRLRAAARVARDLLHRDLGGAANHSMLYLVMGVDDAGGRMSLDAEDKLRIAWPGLGDQPLLGRIREEMMAATAQLHGTFMPLDRWNPWTGEGTLVTAHPLGGCRLGEDADEGAVDSEGRLFDGRGGVHAGLYVADASIIPSPLGVNPLLTISALAERIAESMLAAASAEVWHG